MDRFDLHDTGLFGFCERHIIFRGNGDGSAAGGDRLLPDRITDFGKPESLRKETNQ